MAPLVNLTAKSHRFLLQFQKEYETFGHYMKPLMLTVSFLLFSTPLFSQATRADLMKQLAQEACLEVKKVDFSNKSVDEIKIALGLPLVMVAGKHMAELKALGYDISDSQSAQKLGGEIGVQLAQECPEVLSAMLKNPNALGEIAQSSRSNASQSISGTLVRIVEGDFSHLQVTDAKGKVEKLWWMEYFDGSNALAANPQSRLNKPITVKYVEREMFNSTLKEYVKVKVITGIE